jgi:hypothetical protein
MNIIHAVPTLGQSGGGPPRSVSQLCNALVAHGSSIGIVTAVDVNDPIVALDSGIDLTVLEDRGASFLDRLRSADFGGALNTLNQDTGISLIHQHGIWLRSSQAGTSFGYDQQLPLVVVLRGMLEPLAINDSKWKKNGVGALSKARFIAWDCFSCDGSFRS